MAFHDYTKINFKDAPDHKTTPVNAANLNHMESGIADAFTDIGKLAADIADVEIGTTASRAYSVGELVYVGGTLYRVKTAIASGATFTEGTNVEEKNVSDAIINSSNGIVASGITHETTNKTSILNFAVSSGVSFASNAWTTYVTIAPIELRPRVNSYAVVYLGVGMGLLSLRTDGVISIFNPNANAGTQLYGQIAIIN